MSFTYSIKEEGVTYKHDERKLRAGVWESKEKGIVGGTTRIIDGVMCYGSPRNTPTRIQRILRRKISVLWEPVRKGQLMWLQTGG